MLSPKFEMTVAFPGVVDLIPVGDLCKEGSGIFCQRVERETVDDDPSNLMRWLAVSELNENSQRPT